MIKTCAIILEPLQGEGGIYPATKMNLWMGTVNFVVKDILMICDEINAEWQEQDICLHGRSTILNLIS